MKSNIEWKRWGDIDPLYGVATWGGKGKTDPNPWTDHEFYALGESDWVDFLARWQRYGVDNEACAEIGSGAGRVTNAMGRTFQQVVGLDVSEGMVSYAREHVKQNNVEFMVTDGYHIPLIDNSVTAVFSSHVFQHFDSLTDATKYLREIHRVLRPGKSIMVHIPVFQWPGSPKLFLPIYSVRKALGQIRAQILRHRLVHGSSRLFMRGLWYEIDWIFRELRQLAFTDVELASFETKSNGAIHSFIFARKISSQQHTRV